MAFRRRYTRFRPDENAVQLTPVDRPPRTARVVNESYGGIAVEVDDPSGLEEGQEVSIDLEAVSCEAVIASLRRLEDGGTLVGLKWIEMEGEDESEDSQEDESPSSTDP